MKYALRTLLPIAALLLIFFPITGSFAIVAGKAARAGSVPFQAEIYSVYTYPKPSGNEIGKPLWELQHRCGGSLIADGWVLTAAHCINAERIANGYRVRLGATNIGKGEGVTYLIDRMVRHADYQDCDNIPVSDCTHLDDIALIHFVRDRDTRRAESGPIAPIALHDFAKRYPPIDSRSTLHAFGWGRTSADGRNSPLLRHATLALIANTDCIKPLPYRRAVNASVMCAGGGEDACRDDSGGPLVAYMPGPVLVGIISWGRGCGDPAYPGIYIRVSAYADWIRRALAAPASVSELR